MDYESNQERDDHIVHNVGACFADVDFETRKSLEQQQALGEALDATEQASEAKTAFLSNMSHEIRTPMNAIIGLNNIALNESGLSDKLQEYLPRIFEDFSQEDSSTTSKYGSTGPGMPIAKNIVELMNGRIEVESEKGVGTTFTVTITLGESNRTCDSILEGEINPGKLSVLAVNDDPIVLD